MHGILSPETVALAMDLLPRVRALRHAWLEELVVAVGRQKPRYLVTAGHKEMLDLYGRAFQASLLDTYLEDWVGLQREESIPFHRIAFDLQGDEQALFPAIEAYLWSAAVEERKLGYFQAVTVQALGLPLPTPEGHREIAWLLARKLYVETLWMLAAAFGDDETRLDIEEHWERALGHIHLPKDLESPKL